MPLPYHFPIMFPLKSKVLTKPFPIATPRTKITTAPALNQITLPPPKQLMALTTFNNGADIFIPASLRTERNMVGRHYFITVDTPLLRI
jgi:hypothetical protein